MPPTGTHIGDADPGDIARFAAHVRVGLFPDGNITLGSWYDPHNLDASADAFANMLRTPLVDGLVLCAHTAHGDVIGVQALERSNDTGVWTSWSVVAPAWRNQGVGTALRVRMLDRAFDDLDAAACDTWALHNNQAAHRVNTKLGYRHLGWRYLALRGVLQVCQGWRLDCHAWSGGGATLRRDSQTW